MKKILLIMFIVLFTAASVFCGEFEDTLKKAEQGDAVAQYNLGRIYYYGQDVSRDYKKAVHWYTKAAEQGVAKAQYNLGNMYDNGQGVYLDHRKAAYWYTKAAEQGYASAQYNLGWMYCNGSGVPQNYKFAYVWYSLAVAQGRENAIAKMNFAASKLFYHQLSEAQGLAAQIQYKIDNPGKQKPKPNYRAPSSISTEMVRLVQRTLKGLGYNPGPIDGVTGSRTHRAIIGFQNDIGVAPTGVIDEVLVAQLRLISKINQESPEAKFQKETVVTGTGFFVTSHGHILTCHHVVEGAERIKVLVGGEKFQAKLIRSDPNNDLAILKVSGSFPALAFSPHRAAKMGQDVFTVGYPNPGLQGVSAKYTKGTISSLTGFKDDLRLYQISIPIQPGNSGGALLDEHGNILGIVVAMLNAKTTFQISGSLPQNVNYAVKSLYAQAMIDTMPEVVDNLVPPSRSRSNAIDNAQDSTVMVVCYD